MKKIITFIIICAIAQMMIAQVGCPGCQVTLSENLALDTIYIGDLPSGKVGEIYEADLSFRMPKTTTSVAQVDSTVLGGLPISKITISKVDGLPPGIAWEASQLEFTVANQTDGCARFCGLPTAAGLYMVKITLRARIIIIERETSFEIPLYIAPPSDTMGAFSLENNIACGAATVSFRNNVPSFDRAGYSYFWDFGNGKTSTEENPAPQEYPEVGTYEVSYQAIVDTGSYVLRKVTILREPNCRDILSLPDYFIEIYNPDGQLVLNTPDARNRPLPVSFDVELPLDEGEYTLVIIDDDTGIDGSDDLCGTLPFTLKDTLLELNGIVVRLDIPYRPDTITSVDTVRVFAFPALPRISKSFDEPLCMGDSVLLKVTNYESGIQWLLNNTAIPNANTPILVASSSGNYAVSHTSIGGCSVVSRPEVVSIKQTPFIPIFEVENNLLFLLADSLLNSNLQLLWSLDGVVLQNENEPTLCAKTSGSYTLTLLDVITGCKNSFTDEIVIRPDIVNCTISNTNELILNNLRIFPNPVEDVLYLTFDRNSNEPIVVELIDLLGRVQQEWRNYATEISIQLNISHLPTGTYWLKIVEDKKIATYKIMKQ
jgi:hypothetical protein